MGKVLILTAAIGVNLFVLGVGGYFLYDQIVAPSLGLHSAEKQLDDAVRILTSPVRDVDEQLAMIEKLPVLQKQVEAEQFAQAMQQIRATLPKLTVAAVVLDAWIAFDHKFQGRTKPAPPGEPDAMLRQWKPDDPAYAAQRMRWYADSRRLCNPTVRKIVTKALNDPRISDVERGIAANAQMQIIKGIECGRQ